MKNISRRDFLKLSTNSLLALAGGLGIACIIRFLGYKADPTQQSDFDIGPAENFRNGSRTTFAHIPALVIHDEKGLRAISLTCTHLGCLIEERSFGFECPCHSSRFGPDGTLLKGPARNNLKKLRIEQTEDGNLHVFTA